MDPLAKAVFDFQNYVRQNPKSLIPKLQQRLQSFEGNTLYRTGQIPLITNEGPNAVKEAIASLDKQPPLAPLKLSQGMTKACVDHARDIGGAGSYSHTGSDGSNLSKRLDRYGRWNGKIGENIDFGSHDAEEVIISLIIDDGNTNRGHRKNIFNPDFKLVGLAASKHAESEICVVIDYATEFEEGAFAETNPMNNLMGGKPEPYQSPLGKGNQGPLDFQGLARGVWQAQNQLRKSPQSFIPKLEARLQYFQGNKYCLPGKIPLITNEGPSAVKEAIEFLRKQQPIAELVQKDGLRQAAQDHANDIGPKGLVSHSGSDGSSMTTRIERYGEWSGQIGENIEFGSFDPDEVVINLLIDDGNMNRGHRKNIFNTNFKVTGVAAQEHKEMEVCVVIDYATEFIQKGESATKGDVSPTLKGLLNKSPYDSSPINKGYDTSPTKGTVTSFSPQNQARFDPERLAKGVFEAQNKLRRDPASFIPLLEARVKYFEQNTLKLPGQIPLLTSEGPKAVYEAINVLSSTAPVPELELKEGIARACRDHANDIGPKGSFSHTGSDGSNMGARLNRYGKWNGQIGENIDFGSFDPEEVIVSLLVDDGNHNRGHRKNMLNPNFRKTGVAASKHAEMKVCVVIDYASEYSGLGEKIVQESNPSSLNSLTKIGSSPYSPLKTTNMPTSFTDKVNPPKDLFAAKDRKIDYDYFAREVFEAQNQLRRYPMSFVPKLEQKLSYFQGNKLCLPHEIPLLTNEGPKAVLEAINFLKQQESIPPLEIKEGMDRACRDHAKDIGLKGSISHTGSDGSTMSSRLERYGQWRGQIGENIDFGSFNADDVVLSLLVDDGNASRGHRTNMFNPNFRFTGIAAHFHADMQICVVIDYAASYSNSDEKLIDYSGGGQQTKPPLNPNLYQSNPNLYQSNLNVGGRPQLYRQDPEDDFIPISTYSLRPISEPDIYKRLALQVFELQNNLRQNPPGFIPVLENHLRHYKGLELHLPNQVPIITKEGTAAVLETIETLKQTDPLPAILWSPSIAKACQDHANDIGSKGSYSHVGSDGSQLGARLDRYGHWSGTIGENIDFGSFNPENVLASLLIDDGNANRGHRRNILNPKFRLGGTAAAKHSEIDVCVVLNYACEYIRSGHSRTPSHSGSSPKSGTHAGSSSTKNAYPLSKGTDQTSFSSALPTNKLPTTQTTKPTPTYQSPFTNYTITNEPTRKDTNPTAKYQPATSNTYQPTTGTTYQPTASNTFQPKTQDPVRFSDSDTIVQPQKTTIDNSSAKPYQSQQTQLQPQKKEKEAVHDHMQFAREVFDVQNQIRKSPSNFVPLLEDLLQYFDGNTLRKPGEIPLVTNEGPSAVREAISALKSQAPLPVLQWSAEMTKAANDHAKDIGPKGLFSHSGSDNSSMSTRLERYGKWNGQIGESIDFGSVKAEDVVLSLIVDDGNQSRGHRKNMLSPVFRFTGVASAEHRDLRNCVVIDYASEYSSLTSSQPETSYSQYTRKEEPKSKENPRSQSPLSVSRENSNTGTYKPATDTQYKPTTTYQPPTSTTYQPKTYQSTYQPSTQYSSPNSQLKSSGYSPVTKDQSPTGSRDSNPSQKYGGYQSTYLSKQQDTSPKAQGGASPNRTSYERPSYDKKKSYETPKQSAPENTRFTDSDTIVQAEPKTQTGTYQPKTTTYQPISTKYQSPGGTTYQPTTTYQGAGSTYQPTTSTTYQPTSTTTYQPKASNYQSTGSTYQPSGTTTYQPSTSTTYQPKTTYQPGSTTYQPTHSTYQPTAGTTATSQPTGTGYQPSGSTYKPSTYTSAYSKPNETNKSNEVPTRVSEQGTINRTVQHEEPQKPSSFQIGDLAGIPGLEGLSKLAALNENDPHRPPDAISSSFKQETIFENGMKKTILNKTYTFPDGTTKTVRVDFK